MMVDLNWPNGLGGVVRFFFVFFFSIFSCSSLLAHWDGTILAILVENHQSNIPVKYD